MGDKSEIGWTDATWNPVTGCSKVSPGCAHCYAEDLTMRFAKTWGVPGLPWTPKNASENVILHPERLDQPLRWRKPRMVFVNSMSDLFHEQVPDEYIAQVFTVMRRADEHTFQVLTKRPERMFDVMQRLSWRSPTTEERDNEDLPWWRRRGHQAYVMDDLETAQGLSLTIGPAHICPNVWLGVSIENRRFVHRADILRETPAAVRFISAEPLLGPLVPVSVLASGDNPVDGGSGRSGLQSGPVGRAGDSARRDDLASGGASRETMGARDETDPLRAEAGGEPTAGRLPTGQGDVRGRSSARAGSQTGVGSVQRRAEGGAGDDRESQERRQGRQPLRELGADDLHRAGASREGSPGASRLAESGWAGESPSQAHLGDGRRDASALPGGRESVEAGGDVRGGSADSLEDCQERALGALDLAGIDWLIAGGESGPKARRCDPEWVRDLRDLCQETNTAFFFKQWGGHTPKAGGRELDGRTWDEFPERAGVVA